MQSGYGVSGSQADEVAATYRANGQAATLADGEGNLTSYEYDGHDRLLITAFPSTTQGAGSSSVTDLIKYQYDAGSNIVRIRGITVTGITVTVH